MIQATSTPVRTLAELARPLIAQFNSFCETNGLIGYVQADHICIKCSSSVIYERRRKDFESKSTFLFQSMIAGRRIAIFALKEALQTRVGEIRFLELSDQKPDNSQIDRIDHIEMVPVGISYDELVSKLKASGVDMQEVVRPHHTTHDIRLPSGFLVRISHEMLIDKIAHKEMI
jgi:predicted metalloenzyme YecM